ncbi:hypothetical protein [Halobaculum roseum]|uniref:Uncharacterized protein n=1 Tax=Halobaculum roseum TaxID=2175149 RepID=A0ABD5MU72_9EURY|nr:hypothetical protein [Halobaculum roseum]QZY04465.1 hypothetical protein K6T36_17480 [Halobaculum roseum]
MGSDPASDDQGAGSRPDADDVLEQLAAKASVDDSVADATVVETHRERARRRSERILTASDGRAKRSWILPGTYERQCDERVAYADRYDAAPDGLGTKRVPYVETGRPVETCPGCDGEERTTCSRCGGDKEADCRTCNGDGNTTCSACDGDPVSECDDCEDGTQPCSACGGSASEDCPECGGSGGHTETGQCPRCEGDGWINCEDCDGEGGECDTCGGESTVDCPRCDGDGVDDRWIDCSRCGGRKSLGCSSCDGTGTERCDTCGGTTTLSCDACNGSGSEPCDDCDESGVVRCTDCDENGTVTCGQCKGVGEVVHAVSGELVFDVDTAAELDTERVPGDWISSQDGTVVDRERDDPENAGGVYRRVIEEEEIPAMTITYRHAGGEYEAAIVDGTLRYDDAPKPAENIQAQIEHAVDSGVFEYDSGRSFGETVRAAPGALVADGARIGAGVVLTSVVLLGVGLATTLVPIGDGLQDAVGVGAAAVAALWYAQRTGADEEGISTASNGGGLLAPAILGVAAVGATIQGVVGPASGLLALALAAGLWSRRVAGRLAFERARVDHRVRQRRTFLENTLDGRPSEVAALGLADLLPSPEPVPSGDLLDRVSSLVVTVGLGANVWVAGLLALGAVGGGNLLLDYVGFGTVLVVPAATALVATASLSVLALGRFIQGDPEADLDPDTEPRSRRSTDTRGSVDPEGSVQSREPAQSREPVESRGPTRSTGSNGSADRLNDFQLTLLYCIDRGGGNTGVEIKERMVDLHDDPTAEAGVDPALRQLTRRGYLQRTDRGYYTTRAGEELIREHEVRIEQRVGS